MKNNILLISLLALGAMSAYLFSTHGSKNSDDLIDAEASLLWKTWKSKHGKQYASTQQDSYRYQVFRNTYFLISIHNNDPSSSYRLGLNKFSDLTKEEFHSLYLSGVSWKARDVVQTSVSPSQLPGDGIDWVTEGMVPEVRDMGQCQASYAFTAVSTIESLFRIDADSFLTLSPEQIIQCSVSYGNNGCAGGTNTNTLTYVSRQKLNTESDYPFVSYGGTTGACNYAQEDRGKYHSETIDYVPNDCNKVNQALFVKPVFACIVPGFKLQYYESGIFQASDCAGNDISFCMSIVGVDTNNYWQLQNSWGTGWGEGGYMKLQYGNSCQVCSDALQPGFS